MSNIAHEGLLELILKFVETLPSIIQQASASPLGILALSIICISLIAAYFFWNAPVAAKMSVFLVLMVGVLAYGASIGKASEGNMPKGKIVPAAGVDCSFAWVYLGSYDVKSARYTLLRFKYSDIYRHSSYPQRGDALVTLNEMSLIDAEYLSKKECSDTPPEGYKKEKEALFKIGHVEKNTALSVAQIALLPYAGASVTYVWARIVVK
ncbi:hypothetical protein ACFOLJ_23745 [Rugamonas sp. CCM 8940]|uniref:hypothetical protein n=1 Tax=Rugamonas sp. CCM 8940 TaxID=2765359 RepID=UPI0018F67EEC|nr:hypothetical protein [Rugamonas sp. CCM 8940]MBJ7313468.1 hypothetical protein [Rugamonas sp. CCM 8940]